MNKQGIVKEIKEIKRGVSPKGHEWILRKIVLEDGFGASTFDSFYEVGQEVNLEVEKKEAVGRNGQKYENWSIVPAKPVRRKSVDPKIADKVLERLYAIEEALAIIDAKIDNLVVDRKDNKNPF